MEQDITSHGNRSCKPVYKLFFCCCCFDPCIPYRRRQKVWKSSVPERVTHKKIERVCQAILQNRRQGNNTGELRTKMYKIDKV